MLFGYLFNQATQPCNKLFLLLIVKINTGCMYSCLFLILIIKNNYFNY